jgi:hypothetical protein
MLFFLIVIVIMIKHKIITPDTVFANPVFMSKIVNLRIFVIIIKYTVILYIIQSQRFEVKHKLISPI